ncbi:MAG: hypothetical protein Q4B67_09735, partial [Eubacteriales bacterium]|nr:hypothetical protein [Eubacteriales bacterium]
NGTWMFFNGDGTLKTGWGHTGTGDNKTYYHFNEKGVMETGWILVDGDWYYMSEIKDSSEGAMQRNWHLDSQDGRWYYLDPVTGKMLTGWQKINGKWYFLSPAILAPTWMKDLDDKYHYIGGGRPYGSMYVNEYTPDGYRVGPDGAWIP